MSRFSDDLDEECQDDDDVYSELEETLDDDEEPTVLCSNCGLEILEIVYQCPRCGEIPSREFADPTAQPRWVIFTALILLAALVGWILI